MRKICLALVGIFMMFLQGYSQYSKHRDSVYEPKPLRLDEINLVESYYNQEGNHSAILGGIGNEHVTDLSNGLDIKFVGWDQHGSKHTIGAGLGIDHHTAASAAFVSKTGASKTPGTRVYPSVNWNVENVKGNSFGIGAYYSTEYNYKSIGLEINAGRKISSNTEVSGKLSAFFDKVKLIYPSELIPQSTVVQTSPNTITTASGRTIRSGGDDEGDDDNKVYIPSSPRNTYTASLTLSQIVNTRMQFAITTDLVAQDGYLGLPFHRVYFNDGSVHVENLPSSRLKLPVGFRLNYFLGDYFIIRSFYRYYVDNWGIRSNTAELELPVKVKSFFSVAPFFRYYSQTASTYFAPYMSHTSADQYYTSNYSLSKLTSNFFGVNLHLAPSEGVFNSHITALDLRYGHYTQSTDLYSNIVTLALTFK